MKITQVGRKITSDFTELESQYSNNTVVIDVELTDATFTNYTMFASIRIKTFSTYNYHIPITNNQITLPSVALNYAGVLTVSIYGTNGSDDVITSDIVTLNVVASNPTGVQATPISTDWVEIMTQYVNAEIIRLGGNIAPSINETTHNWFIGEYDTGIRAKGDVCTIDPTTKHWLINGVDTGVVALGRAEMTPATTNILGGVIVGNDLNVTGDGTLSVKPTTIVSATLNSANWVGSTAPYSYELTVNGVTATSNQDITPAPTITLEQLEAGSGAKIIYYSQDTNKIVLKALGEKPTVNIPISVYMRGNK